MQSKNSRPSGYVLAYTTVGKKSDAEALAGSIIEEKLAACVNIVPGITSVYRWKRKKVRAKEFLLIIKTHGKAVKRLEKRVRELSPYELPEFITVGIDSGTRDYLGWISENIR